jgi:hypothetical protein
MTVDELLHRMSASELAEWQAFFDLPSGQKPKATAASDQAARALMRELTTRED